MPVGNVTRAEVSEYNKFAEYHRANWGRMDPIIAGVKRTALDGNREQVVVDVLMSPFAPQHFTVFKQQLGPADDQQFGPIAGNMATLEVVMSYGRLFAGLCDMAIERRRPALLPGSRRRRRRAAVALVGFGRLRDLLVGYVGTTGELGPLAILNLGIPPQSDAAGYAASRLGGWRRQYDGLTVFSFQRDVLETVVPQLRFEKAARPAQVRLKVGDISNARITPTLNDLAYARTRETSLGNLRLLHALNQQLHVPRRLPQYGRMAVGREDDLPLGRKIRFGGSRRRAGTWTSTALQPFQPGGILKIHAPKGYLSPPLNWFRGLDLDATMTEKTVSAHAEVIMQIAAEEK